MKRLFAVCVVLLLSFPVFASEGSHQAHKEAVHGLGSHWSIGDYLAPVSLLDFLRAKLGHSAIAREPVTDVHHIFYALVVCAVTLVLLFFAVVKLRKTAREMLPEHRFTPLAIFQLLADALLGIMEGMMGRENALRYLPFIGTLCVFILFSNLLGLVPGLLPATDNLNTNVAMASVVFVIYHVEGVRSHGLSYFKHFFGPILKWYALPLMLLMFVIELISHFARPLSLSVRLLGNIFGDHAVLGAFVAMAIPFVPIPFVLLGMLVAMIQTLVFCALSAVYISLAVVEEEL